MTKRIFILGFLIFLGVFGKKIYAQGSLLGISLSPPTFELSANPGDVIQNTVRVDNLTDKEVTISTELKNFSAVGEEGSVGLVEDDDSTHSLIRWITVVPNQAVLAPKASGQFTFEIKVPRNAEPGGHFGSILFRMDAAGQKPNGSGAVLASELGSLILLRVAGPTTESANVASFNAKKSFFEYGPIGFEYRIKNTGNVHVKPTGKIVVKDIFRRTVAETPLEAKNVLPGAIRKLENSWKSKLLLGPFRANLVLSYGAANSVLAAETTFVVLPWKMLLIIGIITLTITLILYKGRKRLRMAAKILFGKEGH